MELVSTEDGVAICFGCATYLADGMRARRAASHPVPAARAKGTTKVPGLADLNKDLLLVHGFNWFFRGAYVSDQKARDYLVSFVRLVDRAIHEYESARALLEEHESQLGIARKIRAFGYLETCINSTKRAFNVAEQMRRYRPAPPINRLTMRSLVGHGRSIKDVRDAIEHMDEWIERGEVQPGEAIALMVTDQGDAIEIAGHRVSFQDLAAVLRKLHGLAQYLAAYQEPGATAGASGPTVTKS